jgi:ABC-type bacteriocin/lantibiotic exporter with double-glycine peptidase domain
MTEIDPGSPPARRRFLAPEAIQTSAMDCGPAALKCLLAGHGIPVSYGRLREACQTSVDGTSIDTLETLAQTLGLQAEQIMLPVDHLLLPEAEALPAIVVVRLPSGLTHFVVVWSVHGPLVQVMDPARGRRWVPRAAFLRDVFRHRQLVPAEAFAEWAAGEGFTGPLARRLRALGVAPDPLVASATGAGDWRAIAALDGATRTVEALASSGAVARGAEARRLVEALAASPPEAGIYASATAAPPADDGSEQVALHGAVLLHVSGGRALDAGERARLPLELRAAVDERPPRVARQLVKLVGGAGPLALAAGLGLAGLGAAAEGLMFRGVIDAAAGRAGWLAPLAGGRPLAPVALLVTLALLAGLLALEWPLARGLRRLGARLDQTLRGRYLRKIPRLPDRYFQTRPAADMAERAHLLHRLRALPALAGDVARTAVEIAAIAAGLCLVDPRDAGWVLALAASVVLIPLLAYPAVAERDLRMRNHAGALSRFYLDGLRGLTAARTHRAESALAREHRVRLGEWRRAARGALAAALTGEAIQSLVGFGLATALLLRFFGRSSGSAGDIGTTLLVVYWSLSLPALGQELSAAAQQLPAQRNLTLRLLEPLDAPEDDLEASAGDLFAGAGGLPVEMNDVRVVAGGHQVLEVGGLSIAAGEHLAIVGASGAGKSSLVGLLLGWHRAEGGSVRVGGRALEGAALQALRRRIAWVDPSVYLWNRSLAQNLTFGGDAALDLPAVIDQADLREVIDRLPQGAETPLGEAGGLVSGGEGQRVRLGRGMGRPAPRLVILDEPFRGLPRDRRAALLARVRARWADATLLCVTHDIGETADFPRVLVVEGGQIVEDGAPGALRARAGSRYAALAEAERRVREAVWSGPASAPWRRWRVEAGRVVEEPTPDVAER